MEQFKPNKKEEVSPLQDQIAIAKGLAKQAFDDGVGKSPEEKQNLFWDNRRDALSLAREHGFSDEEVEEIAAAYNLRFESLDEENNVSDLEPQKDLEKTA